MRRRTNTRFASGIGTTVPNAASWDAFDGLPRSLRAALWEAPVSINPMDVDALLTVADAAEVAEMIQEGARCELELFAADHARRFGYPLPHAAAQASTQPYARPSSNPPRRLIG